MAAIRALLDMVAGRPHLRANLVDDCGLGGFLLAIVARAWKGVNRSQRLGRGR
jgi:hypothetical protein